MTFLDWLLLSTNALWRLSTSTTSSGISDAGGQRIAVIGAGVAGSSLVSRLNLDDTTSTAQITVFEEQAIAGGRVRSIAHEYGEFGALEGGANYFTLDDWCLLDLANATGIELGGVEIAGRDRRDRLGPGNGLPRSRQTLWSDCQIETTKWRKVRDLLWYYGLSFWRSRKMLQRIKPRWQAFLDDRNNASSMSLSAALQSLAFDDTLLGTYSEYLDQQSISQRFQHDYLRPCAKGRTYKRSNESTALQSLLAARTFRSTSVLGGNVQLIEQALQQTPANVLYNSTVRAIRPGQRRAYKVMYSTVESSTSTTQAEDFDVVVPAAPLTDQIQLDVPNLSLPQVIPYGPRHITYFSTFQPMSRVPQYDYLDVVDMRDFIVTASRTGDVDIDNIKISEKCGIHTYPLDYEGDYDDCGYEDIYRIVSRRYIGDDQLVDLIRPIGSCEGYKSPWHCSMISWVHRFEWSRALPEWQAHRPPLPESAEIAPNFFYTSGLEHVVSSMEMSCRMGRHVAGQIKARL